MLTFRMLVLAVLTLATQAACLRAAEPPAAGNAAGLEDRLKAGLRARQPQEVAFIEKVATLVRTGRLPAKLVDSTYAWAIDRRKEYPFPAFQKVMRMQAHKLGVAL